MRYIKILMLTLLLYSCGQQLPTTIDNVNKIFSSQDFTLEINDPSQEKITLSFVNGYFVYKDSLNTYRREITYREVVMINEFIQSIMNTHEEGASIENSISYIIKNVSYEVLIIPNTTNKAYLEMLEKLKIE